MSHTSMILTALMTMAMLLVIAPNIFVLNHGRILRNIALWLAIFLGLALFYQTFGPDSAHPMFQTPDAMVGMHPASKNAADEDKGDWSSKDDSNKDDGSQGFTPPKE